MNKIRVAWAFALILIAAITAAAHAQVPQIINYQGRVAVGGVNFDGTGQFKFALVNTDGSATYWSNDGASMAGSEPAVAVAIPVTAGLYSVLLGDDTLTNMTAIPPEVWSNPDVRLRVWFDDGTNGSQLLAPDQRVAAVGYAMVAGSVPDGSITSAQIADGAVGSAQLGDDISLNGPLGAPEFALPATTDAADGVLTLGGAPFLSGYGSDNVFVGTNAGNFSMSGGFNTASGALALMSDTLGSYNTASGYQALSSNLGGPEGAGNYNTATGYQALFNNTTGSNNTADGALALLNNTSGRNNTASGYQALDSNTTGSYNTASGFQALFSNSNGGIYNTAVGAFALFLNSGGFSNTASGAGALYSNTTGYQNTAGSDDALYSNTTGMNNTASGYAALYLNQNGSDNTASGVGALYANTTGAENLATGYQALYANTTGGDNTACGVQALYSSTIASGNTAVGYQSLYSADSTNIFAANANSALGFQTLYSDTTGNYNTACGYQALYSNNTGFFNTAVGWYAGYNITYGSNDIDIGNVGNPGESGIIRIGDSSTQYEAFIAGIRGVATGQNNAVPVVIDSNGQLGTVNSSRRYKEDIADMGEASARLLSLRPVTFRYKKPYANGEKPVQFGLIAEEVAETFPELAVLNDQGQPETVKYQDLAPLLLNEVQKQRRQADAKDAEIAGLKKRLAELETQNAGIAAMKQLLGELEAKDKERESREKAREERLARLEGLPAALKTASATASAP